MGMMFDPLKSEPPTNVAHLIGTRRLPMKRQNLHQFGMMYKKSLLMIHWCLRILHRERCHRRFLIDSWSKKKPVRNCEVDSAGREQRRCKISGAAVCAIGFSARPAAGTQAVQEERKSAENDYMAQMVELRVQLQPAPENERRLRDERHEWRQTAEYLPRIR